MFAVINAVSFLFVRRYMPETRGRTLEELEDDFRSHDAAHYLHEARPACTAPDGHRRTTEGFDAQHAHRHSS